MTWHAWLLVVTGCAAASTAMPLPTRSPERPSPSPAPLTWLAPATYKDVFPTIELMRNEPGRRWNRITPQLTKVWGGARPLRTGVELGLCEREDGTWRLNVRGRMAVTAARFTDVLDYPALTPVAAVRMGRQFGDKQQPRSRACAVNVVWREEGELRAQNQETGDVTVIKGNWRPGNGGVMPGQTPNEVIAEWAASEVRAVDLRTLAISRPAVPAKSSSPPPPSIPAHHQCEVQVAVGDAFELVCRDAENRLVTLLWRPDASSIQPIRPYPVTSIDRGRVPFVVGYDREPEIWDPTTARFLRLPGAAISIHRRHTPSVVGRVSRWFDGFSDDGLELRRYELDTGTYEVLRRYRAGDCPGVLGAGSVAMPDDDGRYATVACVARVRSSPNHAVPIWHEVLDLHTSGVWRTKLSVREILPSGEVIVVDNERYDQWSEFRRAWVAKLPRT